MAEVISIFQILATCIQGVATIGVLATLMVYFFQLLTMQDQLKASRSAATGQNLLALVNFLQDEKVQDARRVVIRTLSSKPFSKWTDEEGWAATKVCTTYDVAGIIIREGLIRPEPIVDNWGRSIKKCYKILKPYISEMQRKNGSDYWDDFDWLYKKAEQIDSGKDLRS